ncbi:MULTISPECIES: serine palmitoyltransferase [Caulobacter]|jgi:8-amino-7-oxononanoate synthase|uniref:8-amino-7-oxononanoate synthase n=1 Tax=Caulobacter rhizosphaerae TaxID=2010972 RepID=A0ABU1N4W5_9CAUL|nr:MULTISPECIES: serine palmitoyltransferase [Caulobacter]KQZ32034.1 8-amino-7-oxononanoate synthase [Caulobacter sp. Root1472]MDR6533493.1 8-amino-7-oxononanoate synthase [Caulobacter rhizosphaerae]GGL42231.1 8-amino-7-oxononanoate synthase [Caulobacter rhizosphaerae]
MGLFDKHLAYRDAYNAIRQAGADPFSVRFDAVVSPTEGVINGKRTILLGTNNYLGLTFDEQAIASSVKAVQERGTGTTGSRIANGSFEAHVELEEALAKFYKRKHAMVFTTGYQANLGVLSTLVGRGDHLILDADSHASIYDGARLGHAEVIRFRHNDPEDLYKRLRRMKDVPGERLIVVEGIYSMIGDTAPLKEIAAVKRELGGYLLVDEAHSMGVLGEHGRGLAELAGVEDDVDFVVGTFSKSLGAIGGFCVSDMDDFDVMRVTCRPYMFTASLPPAVVSSTVTALRRLEEQPELRHKLMANARRLYDGLSAMGFMTGPTSSPIVAITMPDTERAIGMWNALLQNGVYLNLALPPATPDSRPLLRTSVSAAHSEQQIDQVLAVFAEIGVAMGLIEAPLKRVSA